MLIEQRRTFRPFQYQKAFELARTQQMVHWLETEVPLSSDLQDWAFNLTPSEKNVVGNILKSFTTMEVLVGDYWRKVADWFPHPEVCIMASTFSYFESIHQVAYDLLNSTLGLDDYEGFLQEETVANKIDALLAVDFQTFMPTEVDLLRKSFQVPHDINWTRYSGSLERLKEVARSLAIFSAFTEGVSIFSSFAVLLSFQMTNRLKGVGQIVSFSIRDENIHSEGGIYLFRQLCEEFPGLHDVVKEDIREASYLVLNLENDFIDKVFEMGDIPTISKEELKAFIANRTNNQIRALGYEPWVEDVGAELVKKTNWFYTLASGKEFTDFFSGRVSEYSKAQFKNDELW
jgi:ribonucleoside-diphosphate reductase beta chain